MYDTEVYLIEDLEKGLVIECYLGADYEMFLGRMRWYIRHPHKELAIHTIGNAYLHRESAMRQYPHLADQFKKVS